MKASSFIISFFGVVTDFLTTTIGLGLGFYETHPEYHPLKALGLFWAVCLVLTFGLPRGRRWEISKNMLAASSFLGAANNILVILFYFLG
ncbi:MAG: hypothetical protein OEZ48_00230 [Candidatus Bathyarchaeota archaeon]|nr:hypothetical protein [Candidatus Bathyarchaeota archaeon]MDH5686283.1 hypothetical protein [Candidatus Bathyarchaeota archaeon]